MLCVTGLRRLPADLLLMLLSQFCSFTFAGTLCTVTACSFEYSEKKEKQSAMDMYSCFPLSHFPVMSNTCRVACAVGHTLQENTGPAQGAGQRHHNRATHLAQASVFTKARSVAATFVHTVNVSDQYTQRYACCKWGDQCLRTSCFFTPRPNKKKKWQLCVAWHVSQQMHFPCHNCLFALFESRLLRSTQKRKRTC